jgi:hypothetical protein
MPKLCKARGNSRTITMHGDMHDCVAQQYDCFVEINPFVTLDKYQ